MTDLITDDNGNLAYNLQDYAKSMGISVSSVRTKIRAGEVIPSYWGDKPLIPIEEAKRVLANLPTEKPGAAA